MFNYKSRGKLSPGLSLHYLGLNILVDNSRPSPSRSRSCPRMPSQMTNRLFCKALLGNKLNTSSAGRCLERAPTVRRCCCWRTVLTICSLNPSKRLQKEHLQPRPHLPTLWQLWPLRLHTTANHASATATANVMCRLKSVPQSGRRICSEA